MRQRRGTSAMFYLPEPVPFRAHGRDCMAFVVDDGRVFARWFQGGKTHLAWVQNRSVAFRLGIR